MISGECFFVVHAYSSEHGWHLFKVKVAVTIEVT